ncbi:MAG: argininosuccinate lyase [Burkholderiaceae bacterium]|nr:argininosuccinate lyase [Burkholderiaceae bacterium]
MYTVPWGPDPTTDTSVEAQNKKWGYWQNRINRASLVMLTEEGIVTEDEAKIIAKAQIAAEAIQDSPDAEPINDYLPLEKLLIAQCGPMASLIHTGRSRQDIFATLWQARLRLAVLDFAQSFNALRQDMLTLAKAHTKTWIPAYTNGVQAMPISFGFYLWAFLESFERDFVRIKQAYPRINQSSLGSAVLANSSWPLSRERLAELLGFDAPIVNSMDSSQVSLFDIPLEASGIAANIAVRISTLIQDLAQQYSQTRPWFLLDSSAAYSSSAMPQKRNPGILMKTRSKASDVIGANQVAYFRAHNLPLGMVDHKESINEDNACVFVYGVHMLELMRWALGMIKVNPERALEELENDWTCTMALAEELQHQYRVPFRVGHNFASAIVTVARKEGYLPKTFPYSIAQTLYRETAQKFNWAESELPLDEKQFYLSLSEPYVVEKRVGLGAPNSQSTQQGLEKIEKSIAADMDWLADKRQQLVDADQRLDELFMDLLK